jgi:hypothetical protein
MVKREQRNEGSARRPPKGSAFFKSFMSRLKPRPTRLPALAGWVKSCHAYGVRFLGEIVEKKIERSDATVSGDDKICSRVSRRFAGSAGYPSNASGIT